MLSALLVEVLRQDTSAQHTTHVIYFEQRQINRYSCGSAGSSNKGTLISEYKLIILILDF
jgi:hypothetical protein